MEALAGVENLGGGSIVRSVTNVLRLCEGIDHGFATLP